MLTGLVSQVLVRNATVALNLKAAKSRSSLNHRFRCISTPMPKATQSMHRRLIGFRDILAERFLAAGTSRSVSGRNRTTQFFEMA
jgi:hypothetical protein